MRLLVAILCSFAVATSSAQYSPERYPVIPKPQNLQGLYGNFVLDEKVCISIDDPAHFTLALKETAWFRQQVKERYGLELSQVKRCRFKRSIVISFDSTQVLREGYFLTVDSNKISLRGSKAGVFYGLQTLFQLIQGDISRDQYIIPCVVINDYPRFFWRGMHLDVARHFFPTENVKDYLRYMAMYKFNTFHWHLTDDQGWRIEIKKYPLLTTVGAWRRATLMGHFSEEPDRYDSTRYGGYYSQEDIREVVAFADSLHITIVPEIEMPGHARAFLAAYPELGSHPENKPGVACTWGVFNEVMNPSEETFTVLQGILDEVCVLFPGKYVHIGGDECPKDEWSQSEFCQQLIAKNNLKDEHGLQSWFVQRIVTYLSTKGKKAIGWDEILEGGLADSAAVMSWRGEDGGIAAAEAHHNVVMTPGSHCYFDHYQSQNPGEPLAIGGYLPLEKVYSYDPVPAALKDEDKKYIVGVQANVWTEYIPGFSQVQYMIFPRMTALSEVAWTRAEIKDYPDYQERVILHLNLCSGDKINFSRAMFDIRSGYTSSTDGNGILVSFSSIAPYGKIRFNFGQDISDKDSAYTKPILINSSCTLRACVYNGIQKVGSDFYQTYTFHKAMGKKVTLRKQPAKAYNTGGELTLVDGIVGRKPWTGSEWLGWWGDTLDATIDLGKIDSVNRIGLYTLKDHGSWIYDPVSISIYTSVDGYNYRKFEGQPTVLSGSDAPNIELFVHNRFEARYIHIVATPLEKIPSGSEGAGYPAWLFVSEILIE